MIPIKTPIEVEIMRRAGRIARQVKKELIQSVCPGLSTQELDRLASRLIKKKGVAPSFKGYRGFPQNIVTCLNSEVVHGIPSQKKLKKGDLLTIDLGVYYRGFHVDTAITLEVGGWRVESENEDGGSKVERKQFLKVGKRALRQAISQCVAGKRVGDISAAMQEVVEGAGFGVVRSFVGHGVGRKLHEPPSIPCWGEPGTGPLLRENMVLAVEVMYVAGLPEVTLQEDGWTVITKDQSLSAMFEETVVVGKEGPLVLTAL